MEPVLTVTPVKLQELTLDHGEGAITYGIKLVDHNGSEMLVGAQDQPVTGISPAELVRLVEGLDEIAADIIDMAREHNYVLHVAGQTLSWQDLDANPGSTLG